MRFLGIAFCILLSVTAANAQTPACKLTLASSIDLTVQPNRLLLPASVNGMPETLALELDTAQNALSSDVVDALKLPTHAIPPNLSMKIDGQDIKRLVTPPQFHFGNIDLKNPEFMVLPPAVNAAGQSGYLGMALFRNIDFELDLAHGKFNLFLPDHCPGAVVYWTNSAFARLPATRDDFGYINIALNLDGVPVRARLGSSGTSYMGMNAARDLFHLDENSPGMTEIPSGDKSNPRKLYRYAFKSLDGDGLAILHPDIVIFGEAPQPQCKRPQDNRNTQIAPGLGNISHINMVDTCYGTFDLHLSPSILQKLRLYFSTKENLVYATAADAH